MLEATIPWHKQVQMLRKQLHLRLVDVEVITGLHRNTLSDLELGRTKPRHKTLVLLAPALGLTVEELSAPIIKKLDWTSINEDAQAWSPMVRRIAAMIARLSAEDVRTVANVVTGLTAAARRRAGGRDKTKATDQGGDDMRAYGNEIQALERVTALLRLQLAPSNGARFNGQH